MRSASKKQHGSSGAEFEHMLPELAALVSQKFTFSVSISQKNLTQRNVSFQVNSVVTFFGKQTHIPKPIENVYDLATESSAVTSTPSSNYENVDTSTPPKRPRLDRKSVGHSMQEEPDLWEQRHWIKRHPLCYQE